MRSRLAPRLATVALVVASLALIAVGGVALARAHALRSTPAAANDALVDSSTTARAEADVSAALTKVLSYDYAKPDATSASAQQFLRGKAKQQYADLFKALQQKAPGEQLVLTASIRTVGVEELHGDRATLLAFLDQTSKRATDTQTSVAAAQVAVSAQRVGSTWRITGLKPL